MKKLEGVLSTSTSFSMSSLSVGESEALKKNTSDKEQEENAEKLIPRYLPDLKEDFNSINNNGNMNELVTLKNGKSSNNDLVGKSGTSVIIPGANLPGSTLQENEDEPDVIQERKKNNYITSSSGNYKVVGTSTTNSSRSSINLLNNIAADKNNRKLPQNQEIEKKLDQTSSSNTINNKDGVKDTDVIAEEEQLHIDNSQIGEILHKNDSSDINKAASNNLTNGESSQDDGSQGVLSSTVSEPLPSKLPSYRTRTSELVDKMEPIIQSPRTSRHHGGEAVTEKAGSVDSSISNVTRSSGAIKSKKLSSNINNANTNNSISNPSSISTVNKAENSNHVVAANNSVNYPSTYYYGNGNTNASIVAATPTPTTTTSIIKSRGIPSSPSIRHLTRISTNNSTKNTNNESKNSLASSTVSFKSSNNNNRNNEATANSEMGNNILFGANNFSLSNALASMNNNNNASLIQQQRSRESSTGSNSVRSSTNNNKSVAIDRPQTQPPISYTTEQSSDKKGFLLKRHSHNSSFNNQSHSHHSYSHHSHHPSAQQNNSNLPQSNSPNPSSTRYNSNPILSTSSLLKLSSLSSTTIVRFNENVSNNVNETSANNNSAPMAASNNNSNNLNTLNNNIALSNLSSTLAPSSSSSSRRPSAASSIRTNNSFRSKQKNNSSSSSSSTSTSLSNQKNPVQPVAVPITTNNNREIASIDESETFGIIASVPLPSNVPNVKTSTSSRRSSVHGKGRSSPLSSNSYIYSDDSDTENEVQHKERSESEGKDSNLVDKPSSLKAGSSLKRNNKIYDDDDKARLDQQKHSSFLYRFSRFFLPCLDFKQPLPKKKSSSSPTSSIIHSAPSSSGSNNHNRMTLSRGLEMFKLRVDDLKRKSITNLNAQGKNSALRSSSRKLDSKGGALGSNAMLSSKRAISEKYLLAPSTDLSKKCLVLDLDETLVHSSFRPVPESPGKSVDLIVPVDIDGVTHKVFVLKRPHVDEFLRRAGEIFEIVIFTASLSKYANPVIDLLDKWGVVKHRLFREACFYHRGNYVKDLSQLGRDLKHVIIIDNSPASYIFHPRNAIPISTWFSDPSDNELMQVLELLQGLAMVDDVTNVLDNQ